MSARYEVWLSTDTGTRLALLSDYSLVSYAIACNKVAPVLVELPGTFDKSLLTPDRRIEVWRGVDGGTLGLERVYLLSSVTDETDSKGRRTISVSGLDGNRLLQDRIVAYAAGTAQASMTGKADDLIKAIVRQNLSSDAVAARQIASTYLSIEANLSQGPTLTKSFAYRNVLKTLQEIADASLAAGTPLYFDMEPVSNVQWLFRAAINQLGRDHTYPNGTNPVIFDLQFANLSDAAFEEDYSDEITYVYSGGQGEGAARTTAEVTDTVRASRSIFGRREAFADARNESSVNGVTAVANAALGEGKPRTRFTATIADTPTCRYGKHWRCGDRATATYQGRTLDVVIGSVAVERSTREKITARLEA